jgi:hypothetical protein
LSRGSSETQTGQTQPTIGTPVDVPLPKIVIFMPVNFQDKVPENTRNDGDRQGGFRIISDI